MFPFNNEEIGQAKQTITTKKS